MTDRLPPQPGEWIDRSRTLSFTFEGQRYTGFAGDTIGSGSPSTSARNVGAKTTATFTWQKPSFPGTIIAGPFFDTPNGNVHVYLHNDKLKLGPAYAEQAAKALEYFAGIYGPMPGTRLNLVELPNDTVPSWWAPRRATCGTSPTRSCSPTGLTEATGFPPRRDTRRARRCTRAGPGSARRPGSSCRRPIPAPCSRSSSY